MISYSPYGKEQAYPFTVHPLGLIFRDDMIYLVGTLNREREAKSLLPIAPDQQLTLQPDGRYLLEATVFDTHKLRRWLRGYGEHLEIRGPQELREAFRETALQLYQRYQEEG